MSIEKARRALVIKGINSNYIEEAIIILKNYPEKKEKNTLPQNKNSGKVDEKFLIKEAELIINNYIVENNLKKYFNKRVKEIPCKYHGKTTVNFIINSALIGSIILLVYFLIKAF